MKYKLFTNLLLIAPFLALAPTAKASTTWYVNGVSGSDSNACTSPTTACKTITHATSLATSGDSIMVAAAIYSENLTIGFSLNVIGSDASTTIIDGGQVSTVVTISSATAHVTLSKLKIRNGLANRGGGILNLGTLAIGISIITGNLVTGKGGGGGGIYNNGKMMISNSTISGNQAQGNIELFAYGGGILNNGMLTINRSTISGNRVNAGDYGGIANFGPATINNSTISGNHSVRGGGIGGLNLRINNSTISSNSSYFSSSIGGIYGDAILQNSIVANNSGGNCFGAITSNGYNLSSDNTCNFNHTGDLNNTDPMLGPLQNNGGPTKTMALSSGSPGVDAGNPSGCTDSSGHLLKTDQRGKPRPDTEDTGGCDIGAYERQSD